MQLAKLFVEVHQIVLYTVQTLSIKHLEHRQILSAVLYSSLLLFLHAATYAFQTCKLAWIFVMHNMLMEVRLICNEGTIKQNGEFKYTSKIWRSVEICNMVAKMQTSIQCSSIVAEPLWDFSRLQALCMCVLKFFHSGRQVMYL